MIEFLNANVLWWHWVVLGIILLGAEVLTGTFLMLGLGIAAVAVGVCSWMFGMDFVTALLSWALLSAAVIVFWKRYWHQPEVSSSGQSHYGLDTAGTVTETIEPHARGRVAFDAPVLGSSSWAAKSGVRIEAGTRVVIKSVDGQLMFVEPLEKG